MPGPVGRPADTVSPEVSECSRMPGQPAAAASATTPCAPSWAMVTACRVTRHSAGESTRTAATAAAPSRAAAGRSGTGALTRSQKPTTPSTGSSFPEDPVRARLRRRLVLLDRYPQHCDVNATSAVGRPMRQQRPAARPSGTASRRSVRSPSSGQLTGEACGRKPMGDGRADDDGGGGGGGDIALRATLAVTCPTKTSELRRGSGHEGAGHRYLRVRRQRGRGAAGPPDAFDRLLSALADGNWFPALERAVAGGAFVVDDAHQEGLAAESALALGCYRDGVEAFVAARAGGSPAQHRDQVLPPDLSDRYPQHRHAYQLQARKPARYRDRCAGRCTTRWKRRWTVLGDRRTRPRTSLPVVPPLDERVPRR